MKYLDSWGHHNFVDKNNVFVGYDSHQDCCEFAWWAVTETLEQAETMEPKDGEWPDGMDEWVFDPTVFIEMDEDETRFEYDIRAVFRLFKEDGSDDERWLVIGNEHNGYYVHGFIFSDNYGEYVAYEKAKREFWAAQREGRDMAAIERPEPPKFLNEGSL